MPTVATDWAAVITQMDAFLGLGLVTTGLAVALGIRFAPQIVRAIMRSVRSR